MSTIPDELIEQVRDAADIVEVVGEHVELRRTGSDYRGPCPFHGGTHRNLAVIPRKNMFYCFVCHEGGDVFTFFMKRFGFDYPQAVREVAKRVGITITERSTGGPDPNEPLYSAVAAAGDWYARQLREADAAREARAYVSERGFDLEALLPTGIGFAPKGDAFLQAMDRLGIGQEVLLEAGLAVKREDGSMRPRFWGRLLFPIHDLRARVVGFGGRLLGDGEPKYLNSPDTPIFHKGRMLYNLHHAKQAIRKAERAVVVEGYFDVLRSMEAGVEHCVAPLGTGFSPEQAKLLGRYTRNVILLYDSDKPGMRAAFRAGDELLRASLRAFIATPPPGEDPDSLVRKGGGEALEKVLGDAIDVFERKLHIVEQRGLLESIAGRRTVLDRLLPTLRATADPVTRDLYVDRAAEALGVTRDSVRREMESGRRRHGVPGPRPSVGRAIPGPADAAAVPDRQSGVDRDLMNLIRVMLREPEWRVRIAEQLTSMPEVQPGVRAAYDALLAMPDAVAGVDALAHVDGPVRTVLQESLETPLDESFDIDAFVDGSLRRLESRRLESEIRTRRRQLTFVTTPDEKMALTKEIDALTRARNRINPDRWQVKV